MDDILIYLILLGGFTAGSLHNFNRRNHCEYKVKLTKKQKMVILISLIVFLTMMYVIRGNWQDHILVASATIFLLSGAMAEGIHDKGISTYMGKSHMGGTVFPIIKWENFTM
ncbi:hypothetical protein [Dethiobacter alkaliphilus]|uniref:hypothetical protein n=1 Tax=Dethiobacter alkaliphilus TaxID=427926 RepID=UPI0022276C3B|nr:hypothetical protein [Dethiobacter alkaliphilus]MCW3490386.1 hypothetical protein [Dethiobacter alkaliphilus]